MACGCVEHLFQEPPRTENHLPHFYKCWWNVAEGTSARALQDKWRNLNMDASGSRGDKRKKGRGRAPPAGAAAAAAVAAAEGVPEAAAPVWPGPLVA